jgi:hypothetical protein
MGYFARWYFAPLDKGIAVPAIPRLFYPILPISAVVRTPCSGLRLALSAHWGE